jgi:hypothetical protein
MYPVCMYLVVILARKGYFCSHLEHTKPVRISKKSISNRRYVCSSQTKKQQKMGPFIYFGRAEAKMVRDKKNCVTYLRTPNTLLQGLAPLERHHSSHEDHEHIPSSGVPVMFLCTSVVVHRFGPTMFVVISSMEGR